MTCADIQKLLKSFQDDLLLENEYQTFCAHLEACGTCKRYVQSVGSLSNQLWELGQVKVPEDLAATILYELEHPHPAVTRRRVIPMKMIFGSIGVCCVLGIIVFGFTHMARISKVKKAVKPAEAVISSLWFERDPVRDIERDRGSSFLEQEEFKEGEIPAEKGADAGEEGLVPESHPVVAENKPVAISVQPLHWHVCSTGSTSAAGQQDSARQFEEELQKKKNQQQQIAAEIRQMREEGIAKFGQHYSEKTRIAITDSVQQQEQKLAAKLKEQQQIEMDISRMTKEKELGQVARQQDSLEKDRRGAECKKQVGQVLAALGLTAAHQAAGLFLFTATGEKVDKVLEQILTLDQKTVSFNDFTKDTAISPDQDYQVSLYLGPVGENAFHWDIDHAHPAKRASFFTSIKESNSQVYYQSERCVIFSNPSSKIEELRIKIDAMRVPFQESGSLRQADKVLVSKPVVVSACFSN